MFNPNNFDYTKHNIVGSVHIGNHSIYDFEVFKIDGKLWFMCHDDPDFVQDYDEVKRDMFTEKDGSDRINYDGETLDQQLKRQGLI